MRDELKERHIHGTIVLLFERGVSEKRWICSEGAHTEAPRHGWAGEWPVVNLKVQSEVHPRKGTTRRRWRCG